MSSCFRLTNFRCFQLIIFIWYCIWKINYGIWMKNVEATFEKLNTKYVHFFIFGKSIYIMKFWYLMIFDKPNFWNFFSQNYLKVLWGPIVIEIDKITDRSIWKETTILFLKGLPPSLLKGSASWKITPLLYCRFAQNCVIFMHVFCLKGQPFWRN